MIFKHSGDLGDIVYALPTLRCLGGGLLYLSSAGKTRLPLGPAQFDFLAPLLRAQEYIPDVQPHAGQAVDHDLDLFRRYWYEHRHESYGVSLVEWQCRTFNVPPPPPQEPWLKAKPVDAFKVIIHRSPRYQHALFPWKRICDKYRTELAFVGLEEEYRAFTASFGPVRFHKVHNALQMAEVIAGCKLFIGNQSLPNAIAEGLKKPKILELFTRDPNCCFERPDIQYVFSKNVYLPDV